MVNRLTLDQFGPATHLDAAHCVSGEGMVIGVIAEPETRAARAFGESFDDDVFRAAVRAEFAHNDQPYAIQFDPGRDQADEELYGEWPDNMAADGEEEGSEND